MASWWQVVLEMVEGTARTLSTDENKITVSLNPLVFLLNLPAKQSVCFPQQFGRRTFLGAIARLLNSHVKQCGASPFVKLIQVFHQLLISEPV